MWVKCTCPILMWYIFSIRQWTIKIWSISYPCIIATYFPAGVLLFSALPHWILLEYLAGCRLWYYSASWWYLLWLLLVSWLLLCFAATQTCSEQGVYYELGSHIVLCWWYLTFLRYCVAILLENLAVFFFIQAPSSISCFYHSLHWLDRGFELYDCSMHSME